MFAFMSPFLWKLAGVAAVVVAIGIAISYWSIHEYNQGYAAAIAHIAAQDKEAVDAVNKAVSNIADCTASGGLWRAASGKCERR